MARKPNAAVRSVADEPVTLAEARPAPVAKVVIDPATIDPLHPALDPDAAGAANATQNAREMNLPADRPGISFTGAALSVTPPPEVVEETPFTGAALLTTSEEAAARISSHEGE